MLAKRVIPTVLVRGRTAYKGPGFGEECTRSVGSALAICRTHARRGVDELLILDIGATPEGRSPDLDLIGELAAECYIPITVGGGVRTISDVDELLRAGADKVAVGEAARDRLDFIRKAADRFGSQAIVQIVEYRGDLGRGETAIYGISRAAGEVVLQCRDREASLRGYPMNLLQAIGDVRGPESLDMPLVISGGCSGPADMLAAIRAGADAVAAGALFQFTDCTPRDCSRFLHDNGIEVRL